MGTGNTRSPSTQINRSPRRRMMLRRAERLCTVQWSVVSRPESIDWKWTKKGDIIYYWSSCCRELSLCHRVVWVIHRHAGRRVVRLKQTSVLSTVSTAKHCLTAVGNCNIVWWVCITVRKRLLNINCDAVFLFILLVCDHRSNNTLLKQFL